MDYVKPGPRGNLAQCVIRRDRKTSTFTLWQEPPSKQVGTEVNGAHAMEDGKFLLAAQKVRGLRSTEYIISSTPNVSKDGDIDVVGTVKSNFWNTEFSIYESEHPHMGAVPVVKPTSGKRFRSSKVSPGEHAGSVKVGEISYKVFADRPASMECSLLTIRASVMECSRHTIPCLNSLELKSAVRDCCVEEFESISSSLPIKEGPLVLNNKTPWWNQKHRFFYLKFVHRGCALLPSVKNYQLHVKNYLPAAAREPDLSSSNTDPLLLQIVKCGKNLYHMDYGYPLSAFQAFAIFSSMADGKFPNSMFSIGIVG